MLMKSGRERPDGGNKNKEKLKCLRKDLYLEVIYNGKKRIMKAINAQEIQISNNSWEPQ